MYRRDFIKMAAAMPLLARINSVVGGVRLGTITYPSAAAAPRAIQGWLRT